MPRKKKDGPAVAVLEREVIMDVKVDSKPKRGRPPKVVAPPAESVPVKPEVKKRDTDPSFRADRAAGKSIGLGIIHYRVLRTLGKTDSVMDYNAIKDGTGYYSVLSKVLRKGQEGSLVEQKLVKESITDEGRPKILFCITSLGKKLLSKVKAE